MISRGGVARLVVTLVVLSGVVLTARLPAKTGEWELQRDEDGIKVYSKEVPGSDVVAFRGEAVLDAPIARVMGVLKDTARRIEWTPQLAETRLIKQINEFERIEFQRISTPWPIRDRYFIMHIKATVDVKTKLVSAHSESIAMPAESHPEFVEGRMYESVFEVQAVDATHTRFAVQIHADPMGAIPKWMTNLFQRNWPKEFIEGLASQTRRTDVVADQQTLETFGIAH